ncbi:helix-turn-helix domain-containing protein [Cesiribacter sp. SM1]|uniref:helix-turn-helix domain-containing protein n=1 Tax=Cesiribacter sp. SM1 TaxID=2861196 RepID=UPI001CD510BA|nr:helix-turn-helix transcriptional regulator [Cesiribacter sp. SM1]
MKKYSLDEAEDKLIGLKGTPARDQYEFELKLELIGDMIKAARKERNLTQEQLGQLIGVKKAQVSRLENNASNVTIDTILKVFKALEAKVNFKVELLDRQVKVA